MWRLRPDITTARRYYDGIQLPAIPVVETARRGRSRFTIQPSDEAAFTIKFLTRSRTFAVTFSSPYTPKLYRVFSSFSLSCIVRYMCSSDSCSNACGHRMMHQHHLLSMNLSSAVSRCFLSVQLCVLIFIKIFFLNHNQKFSTPKLIKSYKVRSKHKFISKIIFRLWKLLSCKQFLSYHNSIFSSTYFLEP